MDNNTAIEQLADLAMSMDSDIPVDWDSLPVSKLDAFKATADNVFNQFDKIEDDEQGTVIALATIVKLLVENQILKASKNV